MARQVLCSIIATIALSALAAGDSCAAEAGAQPGSTNVHRRGSLDNSRMRFQLQGRGHVAFIGGSITEMPGYRPMVCELLKKRFPATQFTFTDAGVSSTCSTTGAFRLERDVLSQGPVDLFFIEFAVNDDQDAGHARRECIRGLEGIIRHARRHNPQMDIVVTYFVNPEMLATLRQGKTPLTSGAHEAVVTHYGVSSIDLAQEVAARIDAGQLTWEQFGGTHPAPRGNALCTEMIDQLLGAAWQVPMPANARPAPHPMPAEPLDRDNYEDGRFVDPKNAELLRGWQLETPAWAKLPGSCRTRFRDLPLLCAAEPGAELTLKFRGRAIGAYVLAGPDAGVVEAGIDGGPFQKFDLYHRFSRGLHYPRTVLFHADLAPGEHTLRLRMTGERNPSSSGTAMRILQFTAN